MFLLFLSCVRARVCACVSFGGGGGGGSDFTAYRVQDLEYVLLMLFLTTCPGIQFMTSCFLIIVFTYSL